MKKPGLDLDRHRKLGPELAAVRGYLLHLSVEIANAYPRNTGAVRHAEKVAHYVDELRSALEDEMFGAYPELRNGAIRVYYPGSQADDEALAAFRAALAALPPGQDGEF
jgi:hypothetical protein